MFLVELFTSCNRKRKPNLIREIQVSAPTLVSSSADFRLKSLPEGTNPLGKPICLDSVAHHSAEDLVRAAIALTAPSLVAIAGDHSNTRQTVRASRRKRETSKEPWKSENFNLPSIPAKATSNLLVTRDSTYGFLPPIRRHTVLRFSQFPELELCRL